MSESTGPSLRVFMITPVLSPPPIQGELLSLTPHSPILYGCCCCCCGSPDSQSTPSPFLLLEVPTPPPQNTGVYRQREWEELSSLVAFLPSGNLRLFSQISDMSSSSDALGRITEMMMVAGIPRLLISLSQLPSVGLA